MKRRVMSTLVDWCRRDAQHRKPLILEGARQTGKTWLARELGHTEFQNFVEVNFETDDDLQGLFELNFDIERILLTIQQAKGIPIVAGKTLLFFDEIQSARRGLLALKYFYDKMPELHIIAAGSLLGVIDHKNDSFPVGKVEFVSIFPFTFEEFLMADDKEGMAQMLQTGDWLSISVFHERFIGWLREYYYIGGMPEVVKTYIETKDYSQVRKIQNQLLKAYKDDFSKHPPKEIVKRMLMVWNSIPAQLSKENKKYVYTALKQSARARDFETSIQWLCDAGMTYKVCRCFGGEIPLAGFEDPDAFKLYLLDIGLLGAMSGLDARTMIQGNDFFMQYKGALTEQFVLQELQSLGGYQIYYWSPENSVAEVDFLIQTMGLVVPIEVKAERNLRAKSLSVFTKRYQPRYVLRFSMSKYEKGNNITDIPLYAMSLIQKELQ
ncbi:MAG: ATP-binding protein [Bacteroidales bacterium]|nr:ATP-binding protein [Bacteroidales bacterium]